MDIKNNKLKVGYLSYSDQQGGAARGAMRLHQGMRSIGIDSTLIVRRKSSDDPSVVQYQVKTNKRVERLNNHLVSEVYPAFREQTDTYQSFNLRHTGVDEYINQQDFDILIIHWIGADTISIKELSKIKTPIIWRMADEWALMGSLHYTQSDPIPKIKNEKPSVNANQFVLNRKKRFWRKLVPTFVSGSSWLASQVGKSNMFAKCNSYVIPSSLDTDKFRPIALTPQDFKFLRFDAAKNYILFGCMNATTDSRKGFDLLMEAIAKIPKNAIENLELMVFGNNEDYTPKLSIPVTYFGKVTDDELLVKLYSLASVTVVSSRTDNLPFTALESLACATPVVGFNIGGLPDIVDADLLGQLCCPFNCSELADAILKFCKMNHSERQLSRRACREKAVNTYSINSQVQSYLSLIKQVLGTNK